jgi:hypothetical protein
MGFYGIFAQWLLSSHNTPCTLDAGYVDRTNTARHSHSHYLQSNLCEANYINTIPA